MRRSRQSGFTAAPECARGSPRSPRPLLRFRPVSQQDHAMQPLQPCSDSSPTDRRSPHRLPRRRRSTNSPNPPPMAEAEPAVPGTAAILLQNRQKPLPQSFTDHSRRFPCCWGRIPVVPKPCGELSLHTRPAAALARELTGNVNWANVAYGLESALR